MNRLAWVILVIVLLAAAVGGGYFIGHRNTDQRAGGDASSTQPDSASSQPAEAPSVAAVQTAPIKQQRLAKTIVAYGNVIAQPGTVNVVSTSFESRIKHVLVTPGQQVRPAAPLIEVGPSPDTQLQLQQARTTLQAAKKDFAQTQARFNDRLATNQELLTSQQNLDQATLKLDALLKSGAGGIQELKVDTAGVVSKVDVQDGQIVPAGGPLVEIAVENRIEVRLGVEPDDALQVRPGQSVELVSVHSETSAPVKGTVQLVTQRVNPDTRLVDVFVALPANSGLMLEGFVRAKLIVAAQEGLVAPRNAVLPADDTFVLYTVKDNKAVKHSVTIVLQTNDQVLIKGEDLQPGDPVVVVGNYELEDGMGVTVQAAAVTTAETAPSTEGAPTTEPSATEPSTTEASTTEASTREASATEPSTTAPSTELAPGEISTTRTSATDPSTEESH